MTSAGAPNVHKSSRRATLCLTDLVRLSKQVRRQVHAAPCQNDSLASQKSPGTPARPHSPQTQGSVAVILQQQEDALRNIAMSLSL